MLLNLKQYYLLFDRLKWEPVYQDDTIVLCRKRRIGYSDDPEVAKIEAALSIMAEARRKVEKVVAPDDI